jgi:hypothetical protein
VNVPNRALRSGAAAETDRRAARLDELERALQDEARLVGDLRDVLVHQRAGVASSDYRQVEASVLAMSRIVLTLEEARTHREAITATLANGETVPLGELESHLGAPLPEPLNAVRAAVRKVAGAAAEDIAINQRVLRRALEAGDAYLQRLFSAADDPSPVYCPEKHPSEGPRGGVLLNRTA